MENKDDFVEYLVQFKFQPLESTTKPFDFETFRGYILEAKSLMAEAEFLCHLGEGTEEELKDVFIRLGYVANDVKDLFDE
jgi:hypothetical protein